MFLFLDITNVLFQRWNILGNIFIDQRIKIH